MEKIRRIISFLTVVLILLLIVGTVICAVTGSPYFMGMLFLTFAVPVVLWVFMWFTHLIHGDSQVISKEDLENILKEKQEK